MVFSNTLLAGSSAQGGSVHSIEQSIRFNDDDSAYMSRTLSASNRKTFTISLWAKRSNLNSNMNMFGPQTNNTGSGTYGVLRFPTGDTLEFFDYTNGTTNWFYSTSTRVFRDSSAWYHIVASFDTTNAIPSERIKVYINGQRETGWSGNSYPTLNYEGQWNNNLSHEIGAIQRGSTNQYFDGYLSEIVFLDGTATDCNSFGEFNDSGIWIPKDVSGLTFGTNGFHIDGRDASDLGDDESGNGNDFTTSGLATHDQMADTPTNNHAVMNLLDTNTTPNWTASNGNLDISWVGENYTNHLFSTLSMPPTGKWYFEIKFVSDSNTILLNQSMRIGLMRDDFNAAMVQTTYAGVNLTDSATDPEIYLVLGIAGNSCQLSGMGNSIYNVGGSISAGDVINFAREGTNLWVGKNGTYYNSGNPATGSNPSLSDLQLRSYRANMHFTGTSASLGTAVLHAFFGADKSVGSGTGFNNTVPSGFLALNTTNLGS